MKESKKEIDIIKEIKRGKNISENFKKISEMHSAIFYRMASKYISRKYKESRIEFFKEKDYWIYKCIMEFNENKNTKFSTYLANMIKWVCMNNYNKNLKHQNFELIENFKNEFSESDFEKTSKYYVTHKDFNDVMLTVKKSKDPRVYEIFKLRYSEGKNNKLMPWKDVCKSSKVNLSVQGCINLHNSFLKKLKNKYK